MSNNSLSFPVIGTRSFISPALMTLLVLAMPAWAEDAAPDTSTTETAPEPAAPNEPSGAIADLTGFEINDTPLLKSTGISIGAWTSLGGSYNPDNPGTFNGVTTFIDRANTFMFNQFNLYLEKATNKEGKHFDWGFRADIMVGSDTRFTQATGLDDKVVQDPLDGGPRYFDFAAPQLYLEAFIPVGRGLTGKFGHFYTPIGYEVVPSTGNFFYSHAYTMQYGEPFTHTGALFSYAFSDNLSMTAGAVNGWDNWDVNPDRFSGIVGLSWTNSAATTTAAITGITGQDTATGKNRSLYSIVITHKFLDKFTYVLQHDNGWLEGGKLEGNGNARWYGVNNYLFYDITDKLSAGVRAEWFHDADGARVCGIGFRNRACPGLGAHADYYAITGGLNWKPKSWLNIRPEIRYDNAVVNAAPGSRPFDNGNGKEQLLFAIDAVIKF